MRHRTAELFISQAVRIRIRPGTRSLCCRPIHWRSPRRRCSARLGTGEYYGGQPARNLWIPRRPITTGINLIRSACGSWNMESFVGVKIKYKNGKMDWRCCFPYANGFFCTFSHASGEHFAANQGVSGADIRTTINESLLSDPVDYVPTSISIIKGTTHRDGSIHKCNYGLLKCQRITDRDETRLEPMGLSGPTDDCYPDWERCVWHYSSALMQIFSLRLVQIPTRSNSIELYGYMATRDCRDSKLNYIFNHKRVDPITVQQGSLIEMTGPKRAICMRASVLLEFDMRIKKTGQEEEDLQLIDGAADFSELTTPCRPYTGRINGDWGAIDINLALVYRAVEATIEVVISEVHSGFSLSLSSYVSMDEWHKEIQLFHGTIGEPCCLRRFVIAVDIDTWMHLKFKIGQKSSKNDLERYSSFKASIHGCAGQQIIVDDLAYISANVTWSTVPL